ncbi:hypothetical protein MJO28_013112 [Puccinia striiformis f. sp. tritici]|uniref:Uncharacterized protein n=2 Tax=Puccinia striiformis f. sp. tritici TaxID=168172 RepID=A0ACC0E0A1_9BASI|nr:hypothetical protein MJO28_013112 [Puccinia striiformis f. sp. tritici]
MIETSIAPSSPPLLRTSLVDLSAYDAYKNLVSRFEQPSWSLLVSRWNAVSSPPDGSDNLAESFAAAHRNWTDLNKRLGGLSIDKLAALTFYSSVPRHQTQLANAVDARIAIDPTLVIPSSDLLNIASRSAQSSPETGVNVSAIGRGGSRGGFFRRGGNRGFNHSFNATKQQQSGGPSTSNTTSDSWGSKNLTPQHPCTMCWEWGHWAPDCPRTSQRLPALEDPRIKNPDAKLKKSAILSSQLFKTGNVASISADPPASNDALVDSGASHHVTSNPALFHSLRPIELKLRVASKDEFCVDGIGDISLKTPFGVLYLKNALYCRRIAGTVISLGYFSAWDGHVSFDGVFTLRQGGVNFKTNLRQYRCFLPVLSSSCSLSSVSAPIIPSVDSLHSDLWHSRLGHLAIRTLNKTITKCCASGLPLKKLKVPSKACDSCSLAKSQHRPFIHESRGLTKEVGDSVVADLMGRYPASIDGFCYAMVVQDVYSRLTSVIGLKLKSDAAPMLTTWILKFQRQIGKTIRTLRTDNGGEFISKAFDSFLKGGGIEHEYTVPYEHHQNGQVERTNRTLSEMTRLFLIHSKLPVTLWMHAMRHAAWIFNRVVHADDHISPFEVVMRIRPSFAMLRVFGCRAYAHDIEHTKQIAARAAAVIHIGISEISNGWLLWDPNTNKVVRGSINLDSIQISELEAIVDAIQPDGLGDFSLFEEFKLQDIALDSVTSVANILSDAPNSYREAMESVFSEKWRLACKVELGMMDELSVWEVVPYQDGMPMLGSRWVFAIKRSQDGNVLRFKARVVAQGFTQIQGQNFEKTFAPTPTFASLRLLFAMASRNSWPVASFDVKSAFLHSPIDCEVFIKPPEGLVVPKGHVLRLKKALYGTKQAGRCWWLYLKQQLAEMDFFPNSEDQSTYTFKKGTEVAFLWIHVDDGMLTASSPRLLSQLQHRLSSLLDLKWDSELASIIGIRVRETAGGFFLDQPMLIDKLLSLESSNVTTRTPIASSNLTSNPAVRMDIPYLSRIGSLLYLSQGTRPDITYAVNFLARFSMNPDDSHWTALNHLISYIRYSSRLSLPIIANQSTDTSDCITTFVDANWGGEAGRSVHGFFTLAWDAPVSWSSKRQSCIARSTCQAEYMALSFGAKDGQWLTSLVRQLFPVNPPTLLSDNRSAIAISSDCATQKNHRHIEREFHTINELLYLNKVVINWIGTNEQLADILTKALGWRKLKEFLEKVGMRFTPDTLASNRGEVCAGSDDHAPPASVRLPPGQSNPD